MCYVCISIALSPREVNDSTYLKAKLQAVRVDL